MLYKKGDKIILVVGLVEGTSLDTIIFNACTNINKAKKKALLYSKRKSRGIFPYTMYQSFYVKETTIEYID